MSNTRSSRLLGAAALVVSALAVSPGSASAQSGGRQTICVASSIGHRYEVRTIGFMVFGNSLKTVSVASWGLDALVVQRLSAGLGSRYAVRAITIPADVVKTMPVGGRGIFSPADADAPFKAALSTHAKAGCAYVALVRSYRAEFSGTNQIIEGLGVVKRDNIVNMYFTYGVFGPDLFKAGTGERVRMPFGEFNLFNSTWMNSAKESDWPATPEAAVKSATLREAARRVVTAETDKQAQRILKALSSPD